jgi:DEAD/DEAH box helicase domain-containing protein
VAALPSLAAMAAANRLLVSRYDGHTADERRGEVRSNVRIALTNPDMLHLGILPWHEKNWQRFFGRLRYVVVDECHEYRGIFGTNVAYVLRRLRQVCGRHGSSPTFIATSATMREPREHLERLVGLPFECVRAEADGSIRGRRKFWMLGSEAEHFYDFGRKLALQLADAGLTVLAFCPSRLAAERMVARLPASRAGDDSPVRVYRAGLSPEEREEIERGLREGRVRAVFSTSALELGIDIGAIDVVMCVGLPNSMMSLYQRAGRAARAGKDGAILLLPADTPIDSHYAANPRELFARENEPLVLSLSNRRVVRQHYACARFEAGGDERVDLSAMGEEMRPVNDLRRQGRLDEDIFYSDDPQREINIRSIGGQPYRLLLSGDDIGEIDVIHLLREAYRNAIYRHGGRPYRVKAVDRKRHTVRLEPEFSHHETTPFIHKKIALKRRQEVAEYSGLTAAVATLDVTEYFVSAVEKDRAGNKIQEWQGNAGMPSVRLPTVGTVLVMLKPLWERLSSELSPAGAKSALQSCERLLSSLFPTISGPCDAQDFSSGSDANFNGGAALYLFDMVYDGVDLTTGAFERMPELIARALERVAECTCESDEGCFKCIKNPRVEEPASKKATRRLLESLREALAATPERRAADPDEPADHPAANTACPTCGHPASADDRFCRNCGTKLQA